MKIAVIDYGMGNLHSVSKALEAAGADVVVATQPSDLQTTAGIVLPGVGSFAEGMRQLHGRGWVDVLTNKVVIDHMPFLGICLGMQLAATTGDEHGPTQGLGWIPGVVQRLDVDGKAFKVPHMGWNDIELSRPSDLFTGIRGALTFYFVHSYHFVPSDSSVISAVCDHGQRFAAAIEKDNIHLVQFHPEKSQTLGLKILEKFLAKTYAEK
ncbi:MAG: imidazole glycerol phosphate synthase subunit HisH [Candidatus Omnitrophica bacterium]|nr:imidazole glycerol phosphate synthase subunit HisH [Candidatus Omnitrophota bacterium]